MFYMAKKNEIKRKNEKYMNRKPIIYFQLYFCCKLLSLCLIKSNRLEI